MSFFSRAVTKYYFLERPNPTDTLSYKEHFGKPVRVRTECLRGKCQEGLPGQNENIMLLN